jgi:ribosomal protein L3 glutamine methyltransferase
MEYPELLTIRDFIRFAMSGFNEAGLYYGHGTDNAWDEALALLLPTLHLPHNLNPTMLDAHLTQAERTQLLQLIKKRIELRIPVAYLTHEAWFAGLSFYVDERVLIPRSPLAELIENEFQPWIKTESVHRILDLCTGSGCMAVACAKVFPEAIVDASDISPGALAVAKINLLRQAVEEQVHLYESDLFKTLPRQKYDIIISNPPYVSAAEMVALPLEYQHEPELGLAAGTEGLDLALRTLREAAHHLTPHGILIVEVGNSEYKLSEKFPAVPFTWLSFERGGGGVFLLTAEQLETYQEVF